MHFFLIVSFTDFLQQCNQGGKSWSNMLVGILALFSYSIHWFASKGFADCGNDDTKRLTGFPLNTSGAI